MVSFARVTMVARAAGSFGAALAFALAAVVQPVHTSRCPHHRGAAAALDGSPAAHAHAEAQDGHGPQPGEHAGPCTCLGDCERAARAALPATALHAVSPPDHRVVRLASASDAPLRLLRAFTLPYANAPPHTA